MDDLTRKRAIGLGTRRFGRPRRDRLTGDAGFGESDGAVDHRVVDDVAEHLDEQVLLQVEAGGQGWDMAYGDVLYLGMGAGPVTFSGQGRFYITSAPAHRTLPSRLITVADAKEVRLGSVETSNKRTIRQFIHPLVMESCQLVLGYTTLEDGSVWNTMPAHVHDRRMEAYLYHGMAPEARVVHLMGEPQETRHLIVANEQAVISPSWSIHAGAGIGGYTFIWAMAGDNIDYTDMDFIQPEDLR